LFIVNDKSPDRTGEIADRLAAEHEKLHVFHHKENQGSGGAMKTGIDNSTKEFVIFIPVDNPLDPDDLEAYIKRMDVCDIVVGRRAERVGYSKLARIASYVYNRIFVPLLFNIGIDDVNWIQVYRRSIFTDGTISYKSRRLFFLVEILILARRKGLVIVEVPAKMKTRMYGKPTCTKPSVVLLTFVEMIKFFLKIKKDEKEIQKKEKREIG
jgi:glycosyltransferase involved in cell wall biosynthesis